MNNLQLYDVWTDMKVHTVPCRTDTVQYVIKNAASGIPASSECGRNSYPDALLA